MLTLTHADLFRGFDHPSGKSKLIHFAGGVDGIKIVTARATVTVLFQKNGSIRLSSDVKPMIQHDTATTPVIFFGIKGEDDIIQKVYTHTARDAYVEIEEGEHLHALYFQRGDNTVRLILKGSKIIVRPEYGLRAPIFSDFDQYGFTITV